MSGAGAPFAPHASSAGLLEEKRPERKLADWLALRADWIALAIVLAGFVVLVGESRSRYFTPDEALHIEMVNVPGLLRAYQRTLGNAHPPLFFLLLHFWLRLGRSEVVLRMLPAILGSAFLWTTYRWAARLLGKTAGLAALLFAALSPACLPLSAEVRDYTLLLFLSAAALAGFEKAVETGSPWQMGMASVLLYGAILSHYSALFVVGALGVYVPARLLARRAPPRLFAVWAAGQAGAAAIYALLYFSHVANLRGSEMEQRAMQVWLRFGYFQRGREGPLEFVARQTMKIFEYLAGSPQGAVVALLFAAAGMAVLLFRRSLAALLLCLPFVLGAVAGLLGLYPFSGTRHSIYLVPFAAAAIGAALSALPSVRGGLLAVAAAGVLVLFRRDPLWMSPPGSLMSMTHAVEHFRAAVDPSGPVFVDARTAAVLNYYLGRWGFSTVRAGLEGFNESSPAGICLVASPLWDPDARTYLDEFLRMVRVYRLPEGQRVYLAHLGGAGDPTHELLTRFPGPVSREGLGEIVLFTAWQERSESGGAPQ